MSHHRGDSQHPQALLGLRVGPNRRGGGIWQKEILCKDMGLFKKSWEGWRPDSEKSGSQGNLDVADTKSCQNLLVGVAAAEATSIGPQQHGHQPLLGTAS